MVCKNLGFFGFDSIFFLNLVIITSIDLSFDIWDIFPISERENILRVLSKCECCIEHVKERPNLEEYNGGYMPEYPNPSIDWKLDTTKPIGKDNCDCYCRFVCRYICRIDNDEIMSDY